MSGQFQTKSAQTSGYTLYRKWRWKGFGYRSDLISGDYMRRWVLETPWFLIRLHPFSFVSFILRGGYVEYTPSEPTSPWNLTGGPPLSRVFKPGSVVKKKSTDLHYLKLLDGPAWTLVFTTPYHREWGFQTEEGWVPAVAYDAWLESKDAKLTKLEVV
jgi:hypothetical protein